MKETLKHIDYAIFQAINQHGNIPTLDGFFMFVRNPNNLLDFYIFIGLVLLAKYRLKGLWLTLFLGATMGLSDIVSSHIFKPHFHRLRPCVDMIWNGKSIQLCHSGGYSFTSSHAANNMSVCLFLTMIFLPIFGRWGYLFLAVPLLVGYAQIYVGVHYPFDVLGGFVIGALCGVIFYWVYRKLVPQSQKIISI